MIQINFALHLRSV